MRKLLLFDIDGTLLYASSDYGGRAMVRALEAVFGMRGFTRKGVRLGGRCDPVILRDVAVNSGISLADLDENHNLVVSQYETFMQEECARWPGEVVPSDGIHELLHKVKPDFKLGVLTGNYPSIALIKLKAIGIDPSLFPIGAYGTDSESRNDLPKIAIERAGSYYKTSFSNAEVLLIGDTKEDIECASHAHIDILAVGSGCTWPSLLRSNIPSAWKVLDDLSDTSQVLKLLEDE